MLLKGVTSERVKGEYTVMVAGQQGRLEHESLALDTDGTITRLLLNGSQSVKSIAEQVAKEKDLVFRVRPGMFGPEEDVGENHLPWKW